MAKRYPAPYGGDIEINVSGKTYSDSWRVERGMISVTHRADIRRRRKSVVQRVEAKPAWPK